MRGIVVLLLACVVATPVSGAPDRAVERGQKMSLEAVDLARAGQHAEAIALFEQAYALTHDAMIQYNIGQVAARMGNLPRARAALERFLAEEKDALALERGRKALADVLARWPGTVRVTSGTPGALVEIDGKPAGKTPLAGPLELAPGPHTVRLTAPGKVASERPITVTAGAGLDVPVTLVDEAPRPTVLAPLPVAPSPTDGRPHAAANDLSGRSGTLQRKGLSTLDWVLIGTGTAILVAGAVVAGVLLGNRGSDAPDADGLFPMTKPQEVAR